MQKVNAHIATPISTSTHSTTSKPVPTTSLATTGGPSFKTEEPSLLPTPVPEIYKHLNFKIPPEFHREFKTYAASHDISMTALLIEAFYALRELRP